MYIHENNIDGKIKQDYNHRKNELISFKENTYLPMRHNIEQIDFSKGKRVFTRATSILNDYREKLHDFSVVHNIKAQSKFESSFLEEINYYLFKDLNIIQKKQLNIFNKGIYAGLKINEDLSIDIIKKNVDFCIGKEITIQINYQSPIKLIIPAISVEVKTYLDATMFGEVKSSSKTIKSSTPNSKAYVLMGYKCIADEHILASRQDSTLDEMFVLQQSEHAPIDSNTLYEYYSEICTTIKNLTITPIISVPGRLLKK